MRIARWQPYNPAWNQLQQFQMEMNRLFDRWGTDSGAGEVAFPLINLFEEGKELVVEAELPGLNLAEIEIYVTGDNQLTIKGERKFAPPEKSVRHRQERGFGAFVRTLTLPFPVDSNKVEAKFENGVLRIQLAKHASALPRKIPVKAAE